jgi:Ion channel
LPLGRNTSCAVCLPNVRKVREGIEDRRARRRLCADPGDGDPAHHHRHDHDHLLHAYCTTQDWSLVDGFYFAVATLTTASIADPHLVITGGPSKIFTVFYILVGIGVLVEIVRQLGFAYVEVRRAEKAAKAHD